MLDMQAAMLSQQLLERCSLVGGRIVQNHDHLAPQVAQQLAQKQANFFLPDVVEIKLIVQTQALAAGAYGDSRNDRDLVAPSLAMIVNWGTALRGQVIVVLDNSSTHKGAPLQQLLRQHSRLHIEHFPSYAPELNPDEGVWSLAKRALANSCPNDVEELVEDVIGSINAIRISTRKLRGCILQSGLPSFLR